MPYLPGHKINKDALCYEEIDGENYIEHDWVDSTVGNWNSQCAECGLFARAINVESLADFYDNLFKEDR